MVAAAVEFGIGGAIYKYLKGNIFTDGIGSWWAGIFVFIAGFWAVIANNRAHVITTCIFASFGFALALLGLVITSINTHMFRGYTSCGSYAPGINPNTTYTGIYPNQTYYDFALFGLSDDFNSTQTCMLNDVNATQFGTCYCVTSGGNSCGKYDLRYASNNCNGILTTYTTMLTASSVFCAIIFMFGFILAGVTFKTLLIGIITKPPEAEGHLKWLTDEGKVPDDGSNESGIMMPDTK